MLDIPKADNSELRKFALTTGGMIALLFGIVFPWLFELRFVAWPWVVFAVMTAWGLVAPSTLGIVYVGWMRFALILSKITTPIVLGAVFLVIFLPVAIIFRLIGKDPMNRKFDGSADTYRIHADKSNKSSLEKPF